MRKRNTGAQLRWAEIELGRLEATNLPRTVVVRYEAYS